MIHKHYESVNVIIRKTLG